MTQALAIGRDAQLQRFLASVNHAITSHPEAARVAPVVSKIFAALRAPSEASQPEPRRLPVCAHLEEARRQAAPGASAAADAFFDLEPRLHWAPRPSGGPFASANWPEGHANATIVGRNGLERRDDVQIGVSLLAPEVRYPDHRHGPEEVYLVLSQGRFKHGATSWVTPGFGGLFHNPPNIEHAMASDQAPLLAIWCLWRQDATAANTL